MKQESEKNYTGASTGVDSSNESQSPSFSMATQMLTNAHANGLLFEQAMSQQNNLNQTGLTTMSKSITSLLSTPYRLKRKERIKKRVNRLTQSAKSQRLED